MNKKIEDIDDYISSDEENEKKSSTLSSQLTSKVSNKKGQAGPTTKTVSIINNQHLVHTKKPKKILKRAVSDSPAGQLVTTKKTDPGQLVSTKKTDPYKSNHNHVQNTNVFEKNPLERLCEIMTQWNIFNDIINSNNYNDPEDYTLSSSLPSAPIPTLFQSCAEYYKAWEPLLAEEIKANICSNLPHNTKHSSKAGRLIIGILIQTFLHISITNLNLSSRRRQ